MTNKVNYTENNLRKIMIEKGMSQKNLAYCIGVTYQQVHKYVKGTNQPNFQTLIRIVEVLNCKIRDIYPLLDENELVTKDAKNVTIQHYYYNSFWSKVFKMDMNLLRNKIVFITVAVGVGIALLLGYFGTSWLDKSDDYAYMTSIARLYHTIILLLSIVIMLIYTLTFNTSFVSYVVSLFAFSAVVFQLHHMVLGSVGDNEVKRWLLRGIALILAIIWVQIAKRIREKV